MKAPGLIAFNLPQFHPVPENDEWWGKGFTEWTNVSKARPLFSGHYQPHLPADLGFYDLRLPEARAAQAELAREHGIHGFCYYHYWVNGRRILERPVNDMIMLGEPDFPFCLCWANENWTRRWDGKDQEVLLQQIYSPEDDLAHIRELIRYFRDPRYIRVQGKPMFLVYRASHFPDPAATIARWRAEAVKFGLPGLYLCNVESAENEKNLVRMAGFDAAVEFAPDWERLPSPVRPSVRDPRMLLKGPPSVWRDNYVVDYRQTRDLMLAKPRAPYLRYPGVTPGWDNTARRKKGALILQNSTPEAYAEWLAAAIEGFQAPSPEENFIFINAWNEWAEGNHLEPCQKWGRTYLEATRTVLQTATAAISLK